MVSPPKPYESAKHQAQTQPNFLDQANAGNIPPEAKTQAVDPSVLHAPTPGSAGAASSPHVKKGADGIAGVTTPAAQAAAAAAVPTAVAPMQPAYGYGGGGMYGGGMYGGGMGGGMYGGGYGMNPMMGGMGPYGMNPMMGPMGLFQLGAQRIGMFTQLFQFGSQSLAMTVASLAQMVTAFGTIAAQFGGSCEGWSIAGSLRVLYEWLMKIYRHHMWIERIPDRKPSDPSNPTAERGPSRPSILDVSIVVLVTTWVLKRLWSWLTTKPPPPPKPPQAAAPGQPGAQATAANGQPVVGQQPGMMPGYGGGMYGGGMYGGGMGAGMYGGGMGTGMYGGGMGTGMYGGGYRGY